MSDLIERLIAAAGPSRELDEAIMLAVWPEDAGAVAPCFTESLDAAMTLLRAGDEYEITTIYGRARVCLPLNGGIDDDCQVVVRADDNVILAFVEAALRSRTPGSGEVG